MVLNISPLVSVIIPVYNRPDTLIEAVQSLEENNTPFEILIIDDHSTDLTLEIAKSLQKRLPSIKVASNFRGKGAQGARNSGILLAQGELIIFLDSDDTYVSGGIDTLVREWTDLQDSLCWMVSGRLNQSRTISAVTEITQDDKLNVFAKPIPGFGGWIVPKKCLLEVGLLNEDIRAYQEWDTAFRLIQNFPMKVSRTITYVWNIGSNDSISSRKWKSKMSYLSICFSNRRTMKKHAGNARYLKNLLIGILM
jgi:glycosyltransferase involved in cell wall biosynthesis